MKRTLAIVLCAVSLILCGCSTNSDSSEITMPEHEMTQAESTTQETTEETVVETTISTQNTAKSYIDYSAGGINYSYNETESMVYDGDDIVMKVKIDSNAPYECCMGVYVFADGIPLEFTMRECSGENFNDYVSAVSEKSLNHQITFPAVGGDLAAEKYYEITFNPDMFEKGEQILPNVVCTVNNDYYPENLSSIIPMATSVYSIFPPTVNIESEKLSEHKVCEDYKTEKMPEDYLDANDNGFPKFEISKIDSNDEDTVKLRIKGHTINDLSSKKYDDQTVFMNLSVNGELVAVFDGNQTLKLTMNKNTYYTYDVTLDKSALKEINRMQLVGFEIDHENGNNLIAPDAIYVEGF